MFWYIYIYIYIANIEGDLKAHHSRIEPQKTAGKYAEKQYKKEIRKKNAEKKKKRNTPGIGARKTAERHADAPMAAYVDTDPKYTPRMCCMKL